MNQQETKELLQQVAEGAVTVEQALLTLKQAPYRDLGFAKLDGHRGLRQGAAEVIYGAGKTAEQIAAITENMRKAAKNRADHPHEPRKGGICERPGAAFL